MQINLLRRRLAASPVVMYDSVNPSAIPLSAALVASYVDGFGGYNAAVARFGAKRSVSISVHDADADVADVEAGGMTPAELPSWIERQQARGFPHPVVYCNRSTWPSVRAAVGARHVSYWIADWTGVPHTLPGADAVQYMSTHSYDLSWVLPSFPFYTGQPTPKPNPFPVLRDGDSGSAVKTAQSDLNKHGAAPQLAVDGVFGPKTLAAVKQFQATSKLTVDGIIGPLTWAALRKAPVAVLTGKVTYGTPEKTENVTSTDNGNIWKRA